MSGQESLEEALERIVRSDPRYSLEAYIFLYQALDFSQKKLQRKGHVTGQELLEGIREFALQEFGLMARTVLESWGLKATEDFGEMVFLLVGNGLLKKTEKDSKDDFKGVYDFQQAFDERFQMGD